MNTIKLSYYSRQKLLYVLGIVALIGFQKCTKIIDKGKENTNVGYLTYSPGYGVTEGVHITTYKNSSGNEGYILLGSTDNGIKKDYFIVKTDERGNLMDSRQFGDDYLDNIPNKVIVEDGLIYILGDRYDRIVNRTIPYISVLDLDFKSKKDIYIDKYNNSDTSIYQELSADFFIGGDKIIVTSTSKNIFNQFRTLTYVLTYDTEINDVRDDYKFHKNNNLLFLDGSNVNVKAQSIRKGQNNNAYYIAGTLTRIDKEIIIVNDTTPTTILNEIGMGYFIIKYNYNGQPLSTIYNIDVSQKFTRLFDFEIDTINNKAVVLYRNNNEAYVDVVELSNGTTNTVDIISDRNRTSLGAVYAVDTVTYDGNTLDIIDETKSASINKIGNNYIITAIRNDDFAMIVDKRQLNGNYLSESEWSNVWEGFNPFNNTSSIKSHNRNNIGNAIKRIDGNGYAIIGTQDFLNDTKMILMQLDESGNYY